MAEQVSALDKPVAVEVRTVRRTLSLTAIVSIIFFTVSDERYRLEDVMGESGPGMAVLLILPTPLIWSAPIALMCAELATAMPAQGGYYVWSKRALGSARWEPFVRVGGLDSRPG